MLIQLNHCKIQIYIEREEQYLEALKPAFTPPELLEQQEAVLCAEELDVLIESVQQWLLIGDVPHD